MIINYLQVLKIIQNSIKLFFNINKIYIKIKILFFK